MATRRQRRGGAATPNRPRMVGVQPVYEDYKPVSEWSQNDDVYILTIQVPGFMKDQLKVSTVDQNFIRVRGERLVAGNKWSRFQEDFQVPDNSDLTSVRTKHEGGTLIVTVPRKNVAGKSLATTKVEKIASRETLSPPPKPQDRVLHPKTTVMKSPRDPETDQQGRDKVTPTISSSKPVTDDKSSGDHPIMKIGRQEDEQKSEIDKKGIKETEEKHTITPENAPWKDDIGKGKEITKVHEDDHDHGVLKLELKKQKKKAVKGLGELNEERQLLVSMGAALLVIVGISAIVSYSFASQKDEH